MCGSSTYTDKIHLKSKAIIRDKEEHCIMIKGTIQQEDIILVKFMHPTEEHLSNEATID